jgi:hypothetical protein
MAPSQSSERTQPPVTTPKRWRGRTGERDGGRRAVNSQRRRQTPTRPPSSLQLRAGPREPAATDGGDEREGEVEASGSRVPLVIWRGTQGRERGFSFSIWFRLGKQQLGSDFTKRGRAGWRVSLPARPYSAVDGRCAEARDDRARPTTCRWSSTVFLLSHPRVDGWASGYDGADHGQATRLSAGGDLFSCGWKRGGGVQ